MHTNITKNVENTRIFQILFYICDNNDNKDDDINNNAIKELIDNNIITKYKYYKNQYTINNKVFLNFTNGITK